MKLPIAYSLFGLASSNTNYLGTLYLALVIKVARHLPV